MRATTVRLLGNMQRTLQLLGLLLGLALLSACASRPYQPVDVNSAAFLQRALTQQQDGIVVSAAVPTAEETLALTGLDLYKQGIQPVWITLENQSGDYARVITWSIDSDYFSPIEVAYGNRKPFSKEGYEDMQRWFHNGGLERLIPPGESRSGLVYTNLRRGTKGFNLTVMHRQTALDFTFFLPLPGFTPDFMEVDFATLYAGQEVIEGDISHLVEVLESELGCCALDPTGQHEGAPLNVVLLGKGSTVRRAMLRGGWLETSTDTPKAAKAREQRFHGRRPDAIFSQKRADGNERIVLHLWLAPWQFADHPIWVGQVYYGQKEDPWLRWIESKAVRDTDAYRFFAKESLIADMDSAQRYLYQNLWYGGSLSKIGHVGGIEPVSVDEPKSIFNGTAYFTWGRRMVALLSDEARALDEVIYLNHDTQYSRGGEPSVLFQGRQVPPPNQRLHIQESGPLTVATAVPSAKEAKQIFEFDLYAKNVQPVWIQVENKSDKLLQLTPMGIDKSYFTPREAANRTRAGLDGEHARHYETRGHSKLGVPPHSIQSGYIFSRVDEGTKSFNVDVVGQDSAHLMSFFVPVPGLKIDHYDLDPDKLYSADQIREVNLSELVAEIEAMPCCVRNAGGSDKGDPLNIALVGEPRDLYHAFMRAGWDETETIHGASLWKTAASAITGGAYRYSPVSALYVFGRAQDAAMQRARSSIHERNHLRIWMTPLRHEGVPVWIGQISRDIGVRFTRKTITTHKIDPAVDETREFLLEDLAFTQGLRAFGYVGGVGPADYDEPRGNLTGDPYFTDGRRMLMWLSSEPVALDEIERIDLSPYVTGVVGE